MNKRASLLHQIVIQIVLISLVFAVFLFATADKINSRGVRQQVIERQLALLIDSAIPGMSFSVWRVNLNGVIDNVDIREGRVFVSFDGLKSSGGYSYFSRYDLEVAEEEDKFVVSVK